MKAQPIRMLDVALIGPVMIAAAAHRDPPPWLRAILLAAGVGTIVYNLRNYLELERRRRQVGL